MAQTIQQQPVDTPCVYDEADRAAADVLRHEIATRLRVRPDRVGVYAVAAHLIKELDTASYWDEHEVRRAIQISMDAWIDYAFDPEEILRLLPCDSRFRRKLERDPELAEYLEGFRCLDPDTWCASDFGTFCRQQQVRVDRHWRMAHSRKPQGLTAARRVHGLNRNRSRQPRAACTRSSAASGDGPSGDPDPGDPPAGPLRLAPPPRAVLTFGCLTAEQRGATVEQVAR